LKTRLFDRRLQLNFSAFDYNQKNLQVTQTGIGDSGAPTLITANAAAATTRGVEAEFQAKPVRDLQLRGSVAYLHARYNRYTSLDPVNSAAGLQNLDGRPAVFAPDWTVSFDASYRWGLGRLGSLEPGVSFYWADKQVLRVYATPARRHTARLRHRRPATSLSATGWPLVDRGLCGETQGTRNTSCLATAGSLTNNIVVAYAPPRAYGIKVAVDFS